MILLKYHHEFIGDFLGMMPAMIQLSKLDELHISIHPELENLFRLLPQKYGIKLKDRDDCCYDKVIELNIFEVFKYALKKKYYMSDAALSYLDLGVSDCAKKAEFEFKEIDTLVCDYVIAPFSVSLPSEQRWPKEQWQQLTNMLPEKLFCIIGHERDDKNFVTGANVIAMYNEPITKVINLMKNARKGLISVVSGPSHLAFHLSVKNYLLTNQPMEWGNNPEAIMIRNDITQFKAEDMIEILKIE